MGGPCLGPQTIQAQRSTCVCSPWDTPRAFHCIESVLLAHCRQRGPTRPCPSLPLQLPLSPPTPNSHCPGPLACCFCFSNVRKSLFPQAVLRWGRTTEHSLPEGCQGWCLLVSSIPRLQLTSPSWPPPLV